MSRFRESTLVRIFYQHLGKDAEIFIAPEDLPLPLEYRTFSLDSLIQAPPADIAVRTVVVELL